MGQVLYRLERWDSYVSLEGIGIPPAHFLDLGVTIPNSGRVWCSTDAEAMGFYCQRGKKCMGKGEFEPCIELAGRYCVTVRITEQWAWRLASRVQIPTKARNRTIRAYFGGNRYGDRWADQVFCSVESDSRTIRQHSQMRPLNVVAWACHFTHTQEGVERE